MFSSLFLLKAVTNCISCYVITSHSELKGHLKEVSPAGCVLVLFLPELFQNPSAYESPWCSPCCFTLPFTPKGNAGQKKKSLLTSWNYLPMWAGRGCALICPVSCTISSSVQPSWRPFKNGCTLFYFSHSILNVSLSQHVYTEHQVCINYCTKKLWVTTSWAMSNSSLRDWQRRFFMCNVVSRGQKDCYTLLKADFPSLEVFLNACGLKGTFPQCQ